ELDADPKAALVERLGQRGEIGGELLLVGGGARRDRVGRAVRLAGEERGERADLDALRAPPGGRARVRPDEPELGPQHGRSFSTKSRRDHVSFCYIRSVRRPRTDTLPLIAQPAEARVVTVGLAREQLGALDGLAPVVHLTALERGENHTLTQDITD